MRSCSFFPRTGILRKDFLEMSGKLLKKALKPFFASPKEVDQLVFKDIFRAASQHGILFLEETTRRFKYRENRNSKRICGNTTHQALS